MQGSNCDVFSVISQQFPGVAEETHKNITQDSQSPAKNSNLEPPEYKSRVLSITSEYSI
jgi:hypothetical protein